EMDYYPTLAGQVAIALSNAKLLEELVGERAFKLKAESEAKMVHYAKTIAHEIKNAVTGIQGPAFFLHDQIVPDLNKVASKVEWDRSPSWVRKMFDEICGRIEKYSADFLRSAEKIRVVAKTAEGTLSSSEDEFTDISGKVLWESSKQEANAAGCRFETSGLDGFALYGNVVLLQRVLVNLINNAVEAMGDQEDKFIGLVVEFKETDGKRNAYLELTDNGPGIDPAIRAHWFEPFVTTKAGGTGLGLAMVQKYAADFDARISCESSEQGARFRLMFPAWKEEKT
ncbi:MAG: HAMP domain-containing histidine kinase, partial [Proteobacteria bacterium]|nr:HAMP domain-containing histidine kinase [Pseudomonadota bacterium]